MDIKQELLDSQNYQYLSGKGLVDNKWLVDNLYLFFEEVEKRLAKLQEESTVDVARFVVKKISFFNQMTTDITDEKMANSVFGESARNRFN